MLLAMGMVLKQGNLHLQCSSSAPPRSPTHVPACCSKTDVRKVCPKSCVSFASNEAVQPLFRHLLL